MKCHSVTDHEPYVPRIHLVVCAPSHMQCMYVYRRMYICMYISLFTHIIMYTRIQMSMNQQVSTATHVYMRIAISTL